MLSQVGPALSESGFPIVACAFAGAHAGACFAPGAYFAQSRVRCPAAASRAVRSVVFACGVAPAPGRRPRKTRAWCRTCLSAWCSYRLVTRTWRCECPGSGTPSTSTVRSSALRGLRRCGSSAVEAVLIARRLSLAAWIHRDSQGLRPPCSAPHIARGVGRTLVAVSSRRQAPVSHFYPFRPVRTTPPADLATRAIPALSTTATTGTSLGP